MARTSERRRVAMMSQCRAACRAWPAWMPLLVALLLPAMALPVQADEPLADVDLPLRWRFEADNSRIDFELAALGLFGIHGSFPRFEGESWSDPADRLWRIETRIDATSMSIRPERYLGWARSSEFFDVQRYPQIRFRSDPAPESLLREGGELSGRLLLRGVERPVRFEVAPAQCEADMRACLIRVTGEINRRQFGMDSRRMTLSSRVALSLQLLAVPQ